MRVTPDPDFGFRALTVQQPHASAILRGEKVWEHREWTTEYVGDLLITSSAKQDRECAKVDPSTHPMGVAICVVRLGTITGDPEWDDLFDWEMCDVRPVAHLPVKGGLKLWKPSEATLRALGLELGAPSTETREYGHE